MPHVGRFSKPEELITRSMKSSAAILSPTQLLMCIVELTQTESQRSNGLLLFSLLRRTGPAIACRHSIHMSNGQNGEIRAAARSFPHLIEGTEHLYHCGYHSESSFGAASYLIRRQDGNILVDSPRFDKSLLKNIQVTQSPTLRSADIVQKSHGDTRFGQPAHARA